MKTVHMEMILFAGAMALLIPCAISDLKTREISPWLPGIFSVFFAAVNLLFGLRSGIEMLAGLIPGILLLAAGCFLHGMIGGGDGILFLPVGLWYGFSESFFILLCALSMAGLFGTIVLLFQKKTIRTELPFVPFVLAASLIDFILQLFTVVG